MRLWRNVIEVSPVARLRHRLLRLRGRHACPGFGRGQLHGVGRARREGPSASSVAKDQDELLARDARHFVPETNLSRTKSLHADGLRRGEEATRSRRRVRSTPATLLGFRCDFFALSPLSISVN